MKNKENLKLLVIGAGGIGGITAAVAKKAGWNVQIVCKYPDLVKKIENEGLKISGTQGKHSVKMPAVATIPELTEKKDLVFLATKATDMETPARELLPFLHEKSAVISMQNGICEDALASILGRDRTIGCVVGWGATMHAPGELEMTSSGEFVVGNLDGSTDERLKTVQKILSEVVPVEISQDIIASLYSKLIINSCITSLGALCGLYLGEMLSRKKVRNIFIQIMREAMAVADAMKMKVPVYAGKIDYYKFIDGDSWWPSFKRHFMIRFIGFKYRRLKSSSLQSLERGKPTEIDYLNGYICEKGREFGVPTPVNDCVVRLIKEIETGKRQISENNFMEKSFF